MMSSLKLFVAFFLFLVVLVRLSSYLCIANNVLFCPEIEKQALLDLKRSVEDPFSVLSSWNNEVGCCKWEGVVCNNFTGHVHRLHLRDYDLSGKLPPSLCYLKHLMYLDLSGNDFSGERVPSFIGSFSMLEYLNLTHTGFHGTIPHIIGNLSSLHTLSMESWNDQSLNVDTLEWLPNLHQLEHLNMNYMNLSKASDNWVQVINKLPSLVELRLQSCDLDFIASLNVINITSLAILDLSGNSFKSSIPAWILQLDKLTFLRLSRNEFEGPIPRIMNATNLQELDLSENFLNTTIPDWIYSCKDIYTINLATNFLYGTISKDVGNLSSLNVFSLQNNKLSGEIPRGIGSLSKLQWLDLSINKLQGGIPYSLGNLSNLLSMDLSSNDLSGAFPTVLGSLSSLNHLDVSSNKLTGNLPESLGQLYNIKYISLRENMFEGMVSENHFVNLTNLIYFDAASNHLTIKVKHNWVPPFQLLYLLLGSCNLGAGTRIPSWLEKQKNLVGLDLSRTGISGTIPRWIWNLSLVDLSQNNLHGKIPNIDHYSNIEYIFLSSNQLNGPLPIVAETILTLDLSNNSLTGGMYEFLCETMNDHTFLMYTLLLGGNQLSGELPDCLMKWPSLRLLNLSDNILSGKIPISIGSLVELMSLNMFGNKFLGHIPDSLSNCTRLQKIDLADNDLDGNIPAWIGKNLPDLRFLIVRSNKLSGEIPLDVCHLKALQILDLSNNNLTGSIPKCIGNLTAMVKKLNLEIIAYYGTGVFKESASINTKGTKLLYNTILTLVTNIDLSKNNLSGEIPKELTSLVELRSLNLSMNHLTGSIPRSIGDMKQLESLDLSRNTLFGNIPNSVSILSSLSHLNVSYNNLTGRIPESTQLQLMDPSSFVGNNLCGPPLTRNCSYDHDQSPKPAVKVNNQVDEFKVQWLYVFISLGYAVGLSAVCTVFVLKKTWRDAIFWFVEDMWNEIYVYICMKCRRLRRN